MVLASSTVMTPSLPTFSIASAMMRPMVSSLLAEMVPTCAMASPLTGLAICFSSPTTAATAFSMPRFTPIGLAPAATFFAPSRRMAWASTVAVVVPSPAMWVLGFGFWVLGSGFWGFGLRAAGRGLRTPGPGFGASRDALTPRIRRPARSLEPEARSPSSRLGQFTCTWICRGLASSRRGSVTVSTPFLNSAPIAPASTVGGRVKERLKAPYARSMR
jgi:hypothetical protein